MDKLHSWRLRALMQSRLMWPVMALIGLLLFNLLCTPNFFHLEARDGHLYGSLIDILKHGSQVMLLAIGMTLVIAIGGVDLSVGAVMAITGAIAVQMVAHGFPLSVALIAALGVGTLLGAWNGLLVGYLRMQPIVATLVLMVAGRGIAQLVTDGSIITFTSTPAFAWFDYLGNGYVGGLPVPIWIVIGLLAATALATRKTAMGLFIEAVGDNENACRYVGLNPKSITFFVYMFAGLCAGVAGIIAASDIRCADANHAGLTLELDAILAVVLGGTALTGGRFTLVGSMVGALVIQTLTTTLYMRNVSSDIAPLPKAIVILAICLIHSPEFRTQLMQFSKNVPGMKWGNP